MGMAERIRDKRKELGLTQEELGEKLGVQKSAVAKYENGRVENIKRSVIEKMCIVFNCSPSWLMGWDDLPDYAIPIETHRVPLLGEIACGQPRLATEEFEHYVEVGSRIRCDFALRAKGDSMTGARIMDGDIVFIRQQDTVENGQIAAVIVDDEATLKRVYYRDDTLILQAENSAYPPMVYTGHQLDHVRILGLAVAFQSDIV